MTKDELIAKLEQATEGSRELDAAIDAVARKVPTADITANILKHHPREGDLNIPCYSTSLDAALTLIGQDWDWAIEHDSDEYRASVGDPKLSYAHSAPTPALALVIASLKARA